MLSSLSEQLLHGAPTVIFPPGLIGAGWFVRNALIQGVRKGMLVLTAAEALAGTLLATLMADHCVAVIIRRVRLKEEMWVWFEPHIRVAGVPYDFRFYALI